MASFINRFVTLDTLRRANSDIFKHSVVGIAANECTAANPYLLYRWEELNPSDYIVTKSFVNANGHIVSFLSSVRNYVKLHVPGNILTFKEKKVYWETYNDKTPYISLENRTNNYTQTLDVFVNRKRINKVNSYVTVMDGSLDLYVPRSYFNLDSTDNKVWIYVNQYELNDTFREYQTTIESDDVSYIDVPLDDSVVLRNIENFYIYKDGLEQTYITDYGLTFDDQTDTMRVTFSSSLTSGDIITVKYEKDVRWMNVISNPDGLVYIPNESRDFVTDTSYSPYYNTSEIPLPDWPICEHICDIVVNGVKLATDEVKEIAPRLLQISDEFAPSSESNDNRIQIRMKYPEHLQIMHPHKRFTNYKHYFFKYRDYAKWNPREAYLSDESPSWLTESPYPPAVSAIYGIYDVNDTSTPLDEYLGNKIVDRIQNDHVDNVKAVLEQFEPYDVHNYIYGEELSNYIRDDTSIEGMGTSPVEFSSSKVVFTTMVDHRLEDYEVLVFVDGIKIPRSDVYTLQVHNRISAYIDADSITESSVVTLWVIPVFHRDSTFITMATKENGTWNSSYTYTKTELEETFGLIREVPDDIMPLLKSDDFAYRAISEDLYDVEVVENESTGDVEVTFTIDDSLGEDGNQIVLCNASITAYFTGTFGDDGREVRVHSIVKDEDGNWVGIIPKFNNYTCLVFVNGKYMLEGEDYLRFESDGIDDVDNIILYIMGKLNADDRYEVYITENYYEEVFTADSINNAYGIILLENIRVPYDRDYLDLYINNKLIDRSYIEFLTSKIIRVRSQPVPFKDVRIYSKLSIGLHNLESFVEAFEESEDDYYEWVKEKEEDGEIEEWYEGFKDPGDLDPNPEGEDDEEEDEDYDPLIEEIIKDWTKEDISTDSNDRDTYYLPRKIDCNVDNITEIIASRATRYKLLIAALYPEELYPDGLTILFDCNETIDTEESDDDTLIFDGELYSRYDPANVEHLTNVINEHRVDEEVLSDQIINGELDNEAYYSHDIGMLIHHAEYKYVGELLGLKD